MYYEVRKPTEQEYISIAVALIDSKEDRKALPLDYMNDAYEKNITCELVVKFIDELIAYLKESFITVIDGYCPDSSSYAGKLITITWGECSYMTRLIEKRDKTGLEIEQSWKKNC